MQNQTYLFCDILITELDSLVVNKTHVDYNVHLFEWYAASESLYNLAVAEGLQAAYDEMFGFWVAARIGDENEKQRLRQLNQNCGDTT